MRTRILVKKNSELLCLKVNKYILSDRFILGFVRNDNTYEHYNLTFFFKFYLQRLCEETLMNTLNGLWLDEHDLNYAKSILSFLL